MIWSLGTEGQVALLQARAWKHHAELRTVVFMDDDPCASRVRRKPGERSNICQLLAQLHFETVLFQSLHWQLLQWLLRSRAS